MNNITIIITILIVILIILNVHKRLRNNEKFGNVLGALGPYEAQIAAAIDQTNQMDSSKRLQPNNPWNAGEYIESTFTNMQQNSIPPKEPLTIDSKCEKQCESSDHIAMQKCKSMCSCHNNVARYCQIQCQYTDDSEKSCMDHCMQTKLTNCNQVSWTFYNH